ncbi:MAG: 6-phosphofructokinase [Planctomycetes bacterium]|nr:6-phosphofructokinase [Planctomycetota bacterium]
MAKKKSKTRCIGILTSGGDCPGLNAAIRGVAKAAVNEYGMKVIGILDGFRGLVENRTVLLDDRKLSGILTLGGTILGTSRDKPHKMPMGGAKMDMTDVAVQNIKRLQIDCLVCLGGGGTQKNAHHLQQAGVNVLTLPKTIDNDVAQTDITFGFDTAMTIAAEAIDRLHTTATSHHRIIVCEIMGHNAGWLPLGAGLAGGADVILIPEIPYDAKVVAEHLIERRRAGKRFSIVAVAEGAISAQRFAELEKEKKEASKAKDKGKKTKRAKSEPGDFSQDEAGEIHLVMESKASRLARELQRLTGTEARVTSLGHVQRGGIPSATDRLLCTTLGTKAAELLVAGEYNVMVAVKGGQCVPVALDKVAGQKKMIPVDHDWIKSARLVGTCMGDVL